MREEIGKPSININTTVNKLCASSNTDSKDQNRTGMNYTIETPLSFSRITSSNASPLGYCLFHMGNALRVNVYSLVHVYF